MVTEPDNNLDSVFSAIADTTRDSRAACLGSSNRLRIGAAFQHLVAGRFEASQRVGGSGAIDLRERWSSTPLSVSRQAYEGRCSMDNSPPNVVGRSVGCARRFPQRTNQPTGEF